MRPALALLTALAAIFVAVIALPRTSNLPDSVPVLRPIIAELFASPDTFAGRTIEIYGLVIESSAKSEFLLQDVSQRPLRIVGNESLTAAVGNQLTVVGKFHADAQSIYLAAESLTPTKVTGGGGCC